MPIIKKLRKVGSSVVSEIPLINHGGCCVYAAKVGKELEKMGYDVRVVFRKAGNVKKNNPEIKCPLLAEEEIGVDFYHVGLAVKSGGKWYTHDAEATHKGLKVFGEDRLPVAKTYLTVEQAESFASKTGFWNTMYPRVDGKKAIQRAIKQHLKG